jgi:hypothetical protein
VSKNRRRSREEARPADEALADEAPAEEPRARGRRPREPRVEEAPAEEFRAGGRRPRGARPEEKSELQPEPAVSALSGQLPSGTAQGSGQIATEAGRYLRRAARDDAPSRFGSPAGQVDESARHVWEIAFGLVVRRRFEPDTALAEISRTVAAAVHEHAAAGLPILDAEMLVRAALGEIVPTGDIGGDVLLGVHLLLFASLADELALVDAELDALIAEAEEKAAALVNA